MKKICIVHDSVSGSTAEIAGILGKELSAERHSVETMPVSRDCDLSGFDIVIIGSPMYFGGFTSKIQKFIKRNTEQLKNKQVFSYISLLYIIRINDKPEGGISCYIDPSFGIRTVQNHDASGYDRIHSLDSYCKKLDYNFRGIRLKGVAFFNGRLIIKKLPLPHRVFMRIAIKLTTKQREGDFLNQDAVREWAARILRFIN